MHKKASGLVYKDETNISLDDLLKREKSVSIRQRNLRILTTEIYEVRNDLEPKITGWKLWKIFHFVQKPYNLRNDSTLQKQRNCTMYFGTESMSSLVPKIWEIVLSEIKNAKSLDIFKEQKLWTTDKCSCRLCKRYIGNVGFI